MSIFEASTGIGHDFPNISAVRFGELSLFAYVLRKGVAEYAQKVAKSKDTKTSFVNRLNDEANTEQLLCNEDAHEPQDVENSNYSQCQPLQKKLSTYGVISFIEKIGEDLKYDFISELIAITEEIMSSYPDSYLSDFDQLLNERIADLPWFDEVDHSKREAKDIERRFDDSYADCEKDFDYINRQAEKFDSLKGKLLGDYRGEFVLFQDGEVLKSSKSKDELISYALNTYGNKAVFIELVQDEEEPIIESYSPLF